MPRSGLSSRGYWIAKADATADELQVLKEDLTMRPVQLNQLVPNHVQFELYREGPTKLYLPKHYGLQRYGRPTVVDKLSASGEPLSDALIEGGFRGTLRDEQRGPVDLFLDAARDPLHMGGILSLPCGFGKTVSALYLVKELGLRTLVIVHKEFLLKQWRERIQQFLPGASVGIVKAQTVDVEGKDIVIASLQSLSMKEYPETLFQGIGFLIIDECHRVGTEVFSRALQKTNFRYSLGISATVQRKDGMTKAFTSFLGDIVYSGKTASKVTPTVVRHEYTHPDEIVYKRDETVTVMGKTQVNISRMINNITSFQPRTDFLVSTIVEFVQKERRKVLVLSDRKAQLKAIHAGVARHGITVGYYWGSMKEDALNESEKCSVMCATYAYASEGMDVPTLDTLVMASPKSDVEQSCGRILRKGNDNAPVIFDVLDEFSVFYGQARKRLQFYKKEGYRVTLR